MAFSKKVPGRARKKPEVVECDFQYAGEGEVKLMHGQRSEYLKLDEFKEKFDVLAEPGFEGEEKKSEPKPEPMPAPEKPKPEKKEAKK